jgi:hypothetical protein
VISTDTRWSFEGSPYLVNGNVSVQNAATLRVYPGVTVYMASGTSLMVQAGGIRAEGTSEHPIRVLSDKTRQGQTAAAGDWKHWVFDSGGSNTLLEHVVFEHGSGLVVRGAAPIFNYVHIHTQSGPAIEIDLAASLSGVGNRASENALNGILVPSGDIRGNVKWELQGIPYVVPAGVVSVGNSPRAGSITPGVIQQGKTTMLDITGTQLQGLERADFNTPGLSADLSTWTMSSQGSGKAEFKLRFTQYVFSNVPLNAGHFTVSIPWSDAGEERRFVTTDPITVDGSYGNGSPTVPGTVAPAVANAIQNKLSQLGLTGWNVTSAADGTVTVTQTSDYPFSSSDVMTVNELDRPLFSSNSLISTVTSGAAHYALSVSVDTDAALGATDLGLLVDTGEIHIPNALTIIR